MSNADNINEANGFRLVNEKSPYLILNYKNNGSVPTSYVFDNSARLHEWISYVGTSEDYIGTSEDAGCMPLGLWNDVSGESQNTAEGKDPDYVKFDKSLSRNCEYTINGTDDSFDTIDMYEYFNEHLKTYKKYLCDKLPNKIYLNDEIKEICEETCNNEKFVYTEGEDTYDWEWNPQDTDDFSIAQEKWETYKKNLNNDSKEQQLKYDKKLQYNSKKFEIYSLLIVIPIFLFILKKY